MKLPGRSNLFPRLWRPVGAVLGLFFVLSAGSILAARLPDEDVCIQFADYASRSTRYAIFDVNTGRYEPDDRSGMVLWAAASPDNTQYVYLHQPDPDKNKYDLYWSDQNDYWMQPKAGVLLHEGILSNDDLYENRIQWSNDGTRVTFIWTDSQAQLQLTIVNTDGMNKQTVPYTPISQGVLKSDVVRVVGWSGDDQYIAVAENMGRGHRYALWSTNPLRLVSTPQNTLATLNGEWSPTGSQFAAFTIRDGRYQLVMYAPGREPVYNDIIDVGSGSRSVEWSPDGRYAVVIMRSEPTCTVNCLQHWHYNFYDQYGHPLYTNVTGSKLESAKTMPNNTVIVPALSSLTGQWSPDGDAWIFLQARAGEQHTVTDLVSLNLDTGHYTTLAVDTMMPLAEGGFIVSPYQRLFPIDSGDLYPLPNGTKIIIPYWHDGRINVDLIDLENGVRKTVLQGAVNIYESQNRLSRLGYGLWMWQGDDNTQLQVTVVSADGITARHSGTILNDLTSIRRVDEHWLGFNNLQADDTFNVEFFNFETGEQRQGMAGIKRGREWNAIMSPDKSDIAIMVFEGAAYASPSELYLSADGGEAQFIDSDVLNSYALWSPDGSQLAYVKGEAYANRMVNVVNTDGSSHGEWHVGRRMRGSASGQVWSRCY